jgi:hypothetical protein
MDKQKTIEEAKLRAANYMSLKGALEPKDVVLGYKTSLDAQMLNSQQVDFSNPNADKITSTSTISNKQETIEEAGVAYSKTVNENHTSHMLGFYNGAKWQQEKMYSEEEMINFAEFVATYSDKNRNVNGKMLHAKSKYDGAERTIDLLEKWFEQYKTK